MIFLPPHFGSSGGLRSCMAWWPVLCSSSPRRWRKHQSARAVCGWSDLGRHVWLAAAMDATPRRAASSGSGSRRSTRSPSPAMIPRRKPRTTNLYYRPSDPTPVPRTDGDPVHLPPLGDVLRRPSSCCSLEAGNDNSTWPTTRSSTATLRPRATAVGWMTTASASWRSPMSGASTTRPLPSAPAAPQPHVPCTDLARRATGGCARCVTSMAGGRRTTVTDISTDRFTVTMFGPARSRSECGPLSTGRYVARCAAASPDGWVRLHGSLLARLAIHQALRTTPCVTREPGDGVRSPGLAEVRDGRDGRPRVARHLRADGAVHQLRPVIALVVACTEGPRRHAMSPSADNPLEKARAT